MAYEAISNGQFQSTINLSDEFTSRHHLDGNNLVVLSSANNNGGVVLSHSAVPTHSTIFTTTGIPVSVVSAANMAPISTVIVSSSDGSIPSTMDPHHHQTVTTSLPLSTVTVDLPSGQGHMPGTATGDENGGVLLCNIDELSRYVLFPYIFPEQGIKDQVTTLSINYQLFCRYIPENFYADFSLSDTNNLEATTVASAAPPPIQAAPATAKFSSTPIISLANGTILQVNIDIHVNVLVMSDDKDADTSSFFLPYSSFIYSGCFANDHATLEPFFAHSTSQYRSRHYHFFRRSPDQHFSNGHTHSHSTPYSTPATSSCKVHDLRANQQTPTDPDTYQYSQSTTGEVNNNGLCLDPLRYRWLKQPWFIVLF